MSGVERYWKRLDFFKGGGGCQHLKHLVNMYDLTSRICWSWRMNLGSFWPKPLKNHRKHQYDIYLSEVHSINVSFYTQCATVLASFLLCPRKGQVSTQDTGSPLGILHDEFRGLFLGLGCSCNMYFIFLVHKKWVRQCNIFNLCVEIDCKSFTFIFYH